MSFCFTAFGKRLLSLVAILGMVACGGGSESPPETITNSDIASTTITDGNSQVAMVGTELPRPLVAVLLNGAGQAIAGKGVSFVVTAGNGAVFAGFAVSDASGVVRERWTLGTKAGGQTVEIRAVDAKGVARTYASFVATATAAAPKTITVVGGDGQTGIQNQPLATPVRIGLSDQYSNPVPGARITFTANDGGAATPTFAVTDSQGQAETTWSLGNPLGQQTLVAAISSLAPATATAFANSNAPRVQKISGDFQSIAQYSFTNQPMSVKVTFPDGSPCVGCAVAFSRTAIDGIHSTVITADDTGMATLPPGYSMGNPIAPTLVGLNFGTLGQETVTVTAAGFGTTSFSVNVVQNPQIYDGLFSCKASNNSEFSLISASGNIVLASPTTGSLDPGTLNAADGSVAGTAFVFTRNTPFGINLIGRITFDSTQQALASGTYSIDPAFGVPPGTWACTRQK